MSKVENITYRDEPSLASRFRNDLNGTQGSKAIKNAPGKSNKNGTQDKQGKKLVLLYAYNGIGKTRTSMAFKDIAKGEGEADTLYFNAFTEDLFTWDNDF